MTIKLGITLPQFTEDAERFRAAALEAESLGLDSVWVFDHLWPLTGGKERPALEAWTSLAWLAERTERIGIGTLVTRSSLRHPALLAKMAATVAGVAPGRTTVAIGSGDRLSRGENEAFGIPYHAAQDRIDQLRSTVEVVVNHLQRPVLTLEDRFVSLKDLPCTPRPPEPPPVWVGGRSDDALETAATLADGWNGWGGSPERFAEDAGTVLEMGEGRDVELSWGGLVVPGASDQAAGERARGRSTVDIVGGPATIGTRLRAFAETGATHLILTIAGRWEPDDLRIIAEGVKPALG